MLYSPYYTYAPQSNIEEIEKKLKLVKVGTNISKHVDLCNTFYESCHYHDGSKFKIFYHSLSKNVLVCSNRTGRILVKHKIEKDFKELNPHIVKVLERTKKNNFKTFDDWADFISMKSFEKLQDYIGSESSTIKKLDKAGKLKFFTEDLKRMPVSKRKQFYRGLSLSNWCKKSEEYSDKKRKSFLSKHKVGSKFKIECITSISSCKGIAQGFTDKHGVLLNIKADSARKVGINEDESEFLLLKGTEFEIYDLKKSKLKHNSDLVELYIKEAK